MTSPTRADVLRWLERFEAVEAVQRVARRKPIPPAESIRLSLSLIDVIFDAAGGHVPSDPLREEDAEAVRSVWSRLRKADGLGV